MTPSTHHRVYRAAVRLYPRDFRRRYGDDLVQSFGDLVTDRGPVAAWRRTTVDLLLTVPRYRLETVMSDRLSATTLNIIITLLVAGGLISFMMGVGPGILLVGVAVVLAIAQRTTLARALRRPDTHARRRRLAVGAVLGGVFVASYATYVALIGDRWTVRETVLAVVGTTAMFGSAAFLIAGLLTPKDPRAGTVVPS